LHATISRAEAFDDFFCAATVFDRLFLAHIGIFFIVKAFNSVFCLFCHETKQANRLENGHGWQEPPVDGSNIYLIYKQYHVEGQCKAKIFSQKLEIEIFSKC